VHSNVHISFRGNNSFVGESGPILCTEHSNVTFTAGSASDSLHAISLDNSSAAIGTNGTCGYLHFLGGQLLVKTVYGAGIGSWATGSNVSIDEIRITAARILNASGIGAGMAKGNAVVNVKSILVDACQLESHTQYGSGIGSGGGEDQARVDIGSIRVTHCRGSLSALDFASCIGTGWGLSSSSQTVRSIEILSSNLTISSMYGACIGNAAGSSGEPTDVPKLDIGNITIKTSNLDLTTVWGSGIGHGWTFGWPSCSIDYIDIESCESLIIDNFDGSGIGGGLLQGCSGQGIKGITIKDSTASISTSGGACIGGPIAQSTGSFFLDFIVCIGSRLSLTSETGAGIGTGESRVPSTLEDPPGLNHIMGITIQDCFIEGNNLGGSVIGGGCTGSQVRLDNIIVESTTLVAVIFWGATGIGDGLVGAGGDV
jgi:hypothetical protein